MKKTVIKGILLLLLLLVFAHAISGSAFAAERKGFQRMKGKTYFYAGGKRVKNQFKTIRGYTYYFDKEGVMASRVTYVDRKYWIIDADGHLQTGNTDHVVNLGKYSFVAAKDGAGVSGKCIIGKKIYLTDKRGRIEKVSKVLSGLVRTRGRYVFYSKGEKLVSSWRSWNGHRYYFKQSGYAATGLKIIDHIPYVFSEEGQLQTGTRDHLVTVNGTLFIVSKEGKALPGWRTIGGKLYYGDRFGRAAISTTIRGVTLSGDGSAVNDQVTALKKITISIIGRITNNSMTQAQKLNACWNYIVGGGFHYALNYPNLGQKGWQTQLAVNFLTTHCGNCYGFACGFAALAAEIGYHPYVVCGRCPGSRDGAADGYTRHSWVIINGAHYDPEAHYAGWHRGIYCAGSGAGYIQWTVDFMGSN